MELPVRYITIPRPQGDYSKSRALAETLAHRELRRQGYLVTRGSMLDCFFEPTGFDASDAAVFVRWKLIQQLGMSTVLRLAKYCCQNHGTPDFLAAHAARGVVAVEVKLGQEAIKPHQLSTMHQLMRWGVPCEVWRIAPKSNKIRTKQIDLGSWDRSGDVRASTTKTSFERSVTVYGKRR